jgi:hypothetical protein
LSVHSIRLINFMAFQDTGWIELRPITLLFGKNSSGKSAILRALRLLKQSLAGANESNPPLIFATEELDVSSFEIVAHQSGKGEKDESGNLIPCEITFGFRCDISPEISDLLKNMPGNNFIPLDKQCLELMITLHKDSITKIIDLSRVALQLVHPQGSSTNILRARKTPKNLWRFWSHVFNISQWDSFDLVTEPAFFPHIVMPRGLPQPVFIQLEQLLNNVVGEIKLFLEGIEFLGPVRPEPRRIFALDNLARRRWEKQGLKTWISFLRREVSQSNLDTIVQSLVNMGLCEGADPDLGGYQGSGVISEIKVIDTNTGLPFNLRDVGYGMSQVLPVVATSILAPPNSLVMIEQPELHLHPAAQSSLTNVFIEAINSLLSTNDSNELLPKNVRFLLETHSEHIFLRLRRCIAETAAIKNLRPELIDKFLPPENLGVYFINKGNVNEITFDVYGSMNDIPDGFGGFFANDLDEVAALAQARILAQEIREG